MFRTTQQMLGDFPGKINAIDPTKCRKCPACGKRFLPGTPLETDDRKFVKCPECGTWLDPVYAMPPDYHPTQEDIDRSGFSVSTEAKQDEAGFKDKAGKLRMDLLPTRALMEVAQVYTGGANKVGARNWEKGIPYEDCHAAALRHIFRYWNGESIDPDHGTHHLAHAIFWLLAQLHFELHPSKYKEFDNRPRYYKEEVTKDLWREGQQTLWERRRGNEASRGSLQSTLSG